MRRVVITGAGTINALGTGVVATWQAMAAGRSGIGPLDIPDADRLAVAIGAQVKGFDPEAHFDRKLLPQLDRASQFALIAAAEALEEAGFSARFEGEAAVRAGAVLGTSGGGLNTIDDAYRAVYAEGKSRVHPLTVPRLMPSAAASQVSMAHGLMGPVFTVSSACASSNHAVIQAAAQIRAGLADVMVAGGAEAMLVFGGIKAWEGLRVLSPDGCRPFAADRNGMVQGEGAGVVVLEARDHALARGATILAELAGTGMSADAGDLVAPSAEGAARAIRTALAEAGLTQADIGYVNAHGTGTRANDATEAEALHAVFGETVPPVSSTKAAHGHAIGATGALELIAVLAALAGRGLAPTAGIEAADPALGLDVVTGTARPATVTAALSNAFAFGGLNAVLALTRG